ncbi:MAG TPA: ABC transporter permease [Vicinamibacterales bacterium]|nr:ABC transporter permease [Vicinamibacterales bacterium]
MRVWQDLRYALRLLVRAPGFACVAVLTLALGIGANAAIFSVVRSVLLAPLPFTDPARLVAVWHAYPPTLPRAAVSVPGYDDLRTATDLFADVTAFSTTNQNLTGAGEPERLLVVRATASFQPALGLQIARGRWFTVDEDVPGDSSVVVLSDGLWRRRFGGDPRALGQTIYLNDRPHRVVGIAAAAATFPRGAEAWVPIAFTARQRGPDGRGSEFLDAIARLRPGLTIAQARGGLAALARRLKPAYYADAPRWTLDMRPLPDDLVRDARPVAVTVFAAVGLVLLVACANVASLLLARAGHRRRELAVRAALGAAPARLCVQLLVETVTLGLLGGAAGILAAVVAVPLLARAAAVSVAPIDPPPRVDLAVLGFAAAAALASSIVFGAMPAWQLSRTDLRTALGAEARASSGRTGRLIVASEIAVAFAVLVGAGLLVRSFARVTAVDPGFDVDQRVTIRLSLPAARYRDAPQRAAFYAQLVERLSALPGVRAAGAVSELPLGGANNMGTFDIESRPAPRGADLPHADWRSASPRYFSAINIRLVAGRVFDDRDGLGARSVAIVDEQAAWKYWPGRSPIGDRLTTDDGPAKNWREIVGVVRTVHHDGLDATPRGTIYLPLAQRPTASVFAVVHAARDPVDLVPQLREAVGTIDPALPIYDVRALEARVAASLGRRRAATWLVGVFAALALALVAVGVYGVVSYDVSQRSREIGIRIALGADRRAVMAMVVGGGARIAAGGILAGVALALAAARVAAGLLFDVSPDDPATYAILAGIVLAMAVAAAWFPARRAACISPQLLMNGENGN